VITAHGPLLASFTGQLTHWVAAHGVGAVFALMALDALLPAGGELVMLFAGALAAGAVGGHAPSLFGASLHHGLESYLVLAAAGTLGYGAGALAGWAIGRAGGRALVERRGRWLHLDAAKLDRADHWFARYGAWAVLLGRLTPVVRSFISYPAGALETPLGRYLVLTLVGSAIWCFGFAGAGWALGGSYDRVHHAFDYLDVAVVAVAVLATAGLLLRRRRRAAA
jgi:membrane protein DedA with SNARE-associated domain